MTSRVNPQSSHRSQYIHCIRTDEIASRLPDGKPPK